MSTHILKIQSLLDIAIGLVEEEMERYPLDSWQEYQFRKIGQAIGQAQVEGLVFTHYLKNVISSDETNETNENDETPTTPNEEEKESSIENQEVPKDDNEDYQFKGEIALCPTCKQWARLSEAYKVCSRCEKDYLGIPTDGL